ncbi:MAG: biotin transporter BioY [Elusimicrobiota bacterium]
MELSLNKEAAVSAGARKAIAIIFFLSATVMGAFIRVHLPFTPVPVTLQTFFVLLAGAYLGARAGSFSQALYLVLGAAGAPVFAGAACGLAALLGPTGGYLAGFAAAAFLVGALKRYTDRSFALTLGLFCLAAAIILLSGAVWLKIILNLAWPAAFKLGVAPFLAGDLFKACAACSVYWQFRGAARQLF